MVRGNWQKRVEAADARRKENRHRKQASCHKRHYKQWVQDLQDLLDRNCDRLQQKSSLWKLQIWTDTLAIAADDDQQFDHVDEGNDDFVGDADARKKRSKSLGNLDEDKGRKAKGRGRSNSTIEPPYSTGKKKVHPRSKEALEESTMTDDAVPQLCLCRSFFFTGTCDQLASRGSGRKSGGCRYVHFSNSTTATTTRDLTLCHVLSNSKLQRNNAVAELKRAEQAEMKAAVAESSGSASDRVGAMEMVFYLEAVLDANKSGNSENRDTRFSEQISDLLSSKQLYLASVVYIALDEVLVFDRFRDGLLYPTDREFLVAVLGENAGGSRRDVDGSREDAAVTALLSIPGTVLEHILAFLPDRAVAALSRVCTAWHYEIGRNSPSLWKHMLNRRDWPLPIGHGSLDLHAYRDQFLQHYAVVRDMTAIQNGLDAILDPRKTAVLEEVAYQDFSTRKHAPSYPNCCVGLQEWSPNRLLVAYNHDCSLRLFETHGEKVCRELICQRVDPYRNTKKRHCRIVSMGLDEQCVASLCHVTGNPGLDAEAFVLVVITRDDFLLGESSGAADMASGCAEDVSNLKVIDVGEAVLNYLLSSDDGDHRLLQLIDFLSEGGDVGDVEVLASQALASCGYGRFMVEVSI